MVNRLGQLSRLTNTDLSTVGDEDNLGSLNVKNFIFNSRHLSSLTFWNAVGYSAKQLIYDASKRLCENSRSKQKVCAIGANFRDLMGYVKSSCGNSAWAQVIFCSFYEESGNRKFEGRASYVR